MGLRQWVTLFFYIITEDLLKSLNSMWSESPPYKPMSGPNSLVGVFFIFYFFCFSSHEQRDTSPVGSACHSHTASRAPCGRCIPAKQAGWVGGCGDTHTECRISLCFHTHQCIHLRDVVAPLCGQTAALQSLTRAQYKKKEKGFTFFDNTHSKIKKRGEKVNPGSAL